MMAWLRRHPQAIAYVLIVGVFAAGLLNARNLHDELCEKVEGQRALLAALVDTAIAEDEAGGLRLTGLPEFQQLDIETQQYLAALEARSSERGSDGTEARLRQFRAAHLAPAECG